MGSHKNRQQTRFLRGVIHAEACMEQGVPIKNHYRFNSEFNQGVRAYLAFRRERAAETALQGMLDFANDL